MRNWQNHNVHSLWRIQQCKPKKYDSWTQVTPQNLDYTNWQTRNQTRIHTPVLKLRPYCRHGREFLFASSPAFLWWRKIELYLLHSPESKHHSGSNDRETSTAPRTLLPKTKRGVKVRREALAEGRHPGRSCTLRHRHSTMMHCNPKERSLKNISSSQFQTLYLRLLQYVFCHSGTVIVYGSYCSNRA